VALNNKPGFTRRRQRLSGAKKAGLAYEKKVNARLGEDYGDRYIPGVWFRFTSKDQPGARFAQPDGLVWDLSRGVITIVEIKIRHSYRAWWQLRELYEPILAFKFPGWDIEVVEIFQWFDPQAEVPEKVMHVAEVNYPTQRYKMMKMNV